MTRTRAITASIMVFAVYAAVYVLSPIRTHLVATSSVPVWWAGHSFGARFVTDIAPILIYFVAFNFYFGTRLLLRSQATLFGAVGAPALISAAINAQDALRLGPWA